MISYLKNLLAVVTFCISSNSAIATSLDYSNFGITDNEIANAIKNPRPLSISNIVDDIRAQPNPGNINKISLSDNNLTLNGVIELLKFLNPGIRFSGLNLLDLSNNQIRDLRGSEEYPEFESELIKFLSKKDRYLDLSHNLISNKSWFREIQSKLGEQKAKRIIWKT